VAIKRLKFSYVSRFLNQVHLRQSVVTAQKLCFVAQKEKKEKKKQESLHSFIRIRVDLKSLICESELGRVGEEQKQKSLAYCFHALSRLDFPIFSFSMSRLDLDFFVGSIHKISCNRLLKL